jgi:uncharacterized protein YigA (DUF484 family)
MKYLIVLSILLISLSSCKDTEDENLIEQEQIALEKTADSLSMVNREMDSLANSIQETSDEIDVLLNDTNDN